MSGKSGSADLADVANVEKFMPSDFISEDGFGITAACRRYLQPLIEGEDHPPYQNGLPTYVQLQNTAAPRRARFRLRPLAGQGVQNCLNQFRALWKTSLE